MSTYKQIPEKFGTIYPCEICKQLPVLIQETPYSNHPNYKYCSIKCHNDLCQNTTGKYLKIEDAINYWNEKNEPRFVPTEKPHKVIYDSCLVCQHRVNCEYAKFQSDIIIQENICKDFIKRKKFD